MSKPKAGDLVIVNDYGDKTLTYVDVVARDESLRVPDKNGRNHIVSMYDVEKVDTEDALLHLVRENQELRSAIKDIKEEMDDLRSMLNSYTVL